MTVTEKENKKKEIQARAKKVYNISFDYHLTHAIFGGDRLLIDDVMDSTKETIEKLKVDLRKAALAENNALVDELMVKIEMLKRNLKKRKHHILVDYVPMDDSLGGRVICVDDKFIITLPKKILESIKDDTGKLRKEPVEKIREKMAHELGHIVLHTDLVPEYDLSGTSKLNHIDWEADVFAEELLRLYSERDHRID